MILDIKPDTLYIIKDENGKCLYSGRHVMLHNNDLYWMDYNLDRYKPKRIDLLSAIEILGILSHTFNEVSAKGECLLTPELRYKCICARDLGFNKVTCIVRQDKRLSIHVSNGSTGFIVSGDIVYDSSEALHIGDINNLIEAQVVNIEWED